MDKRCLELLAILRQNAESTIQELGEKLNVSQRTIHYDIAKIDAFLLANGFSTLEKTSKGVRFVGDHETLASIQSLSWQHCSYILSQQERMNALKLMLLFEPDYVTISQMCDALQVSRSTVIADLKSLRDQLERASVPVYAGPRYGFKLVADEKRKIEICADTLLEAAPAETLLGLAENHPEGAFGGVLAKCFAQLEVGLALSVMQKVEKRLEEVWSDISLARIVYLFALCLKKKESERPFFSEDDLAQMKATRDYPIVADAFQEYGVKYGFELHPDCVALLVLHVLCAETNNISYYKKERQIKIDIIASQMLGTIRTVLNKDTGFSDNLHMLLSEYLSHAYYRMKFGLVRANDLYERIQQQYASICAAVAQSARLFEEMTGSALPQEEVAGISSLICGECVYAKSQQPRISAIIVTDQGAASTGMLTGKLSELFPEMEIMAVMSRHKLAGQPFESKIDLVLSTISLDLPNTRVIIVDPLLEKRDEALIREFVAEMCVKGAAASRSYREIVAKVLSAAGKVCSQQIYGAFVAQLAAELGPIEDTYYYRRGVIMLKDMLTVDTISLGVSAKTWENAVRIGGNLMVDAGYVEAGFVDAMIRFVKENGPYVVIAPGVALPHARPEDGVKSLCMSLITLDEPVKFGNEDNDPVNLVICFAAVDNSSHIDALAELIDILGDQDKIRTIREAKSKAEILALLK